MSARAIGSGTISFGLVNIPVKVYSASDSTVRIAFNQLHKKCKGRLRQRMFCPTDNEIVPRDEIVRGYEFAKDQYVVLSDEELDKLDVEASKAMEIAEFVPLSTVDPLYFESGYYLGPDKGAERAFKLLTVALKDTQQAAVAKYFARGQMSLVMMRPYGEHLVMQALRYADELKSPSEVPVGESAELKDAELALAKQFIQALSSEKFVPEKYEDEYRKRVKEIIDAKVKGQEITFAAPTTSAPAVVDLMEALKASLAKSQGDALADRKPPKRAAGSEADAKKSAG